MPCSSVSFCLSVDAPTADLRVAPTVRSAYHNGRVNVVELHELVNVDLSRVEESVAEMLKSDGQLTLVQGDLIDRCVAYPHASFVLVAFHRCPNYHSRCRRHR